MKTKDVIPGGTYIVKVSGHLVPVKLEGVNPRGGWFAHNTVTGREVRIRTAAKLRRRVREVEAFQSDLGGGNDPGGY